MTTSITTSNTPNGVGAPKPFVRIVEQPAKCAIRFRYECEGRSAGSIPGVNATPENKTFPTIQVCNYNGKAVVVVSCVTKEPPYKPHPHNLVGKEGCKKGVCTLVIDNNPDMICTFTSLGIQCVKRNKIEESLKLREMIKVDPFRTGFAHRTQASSIDLNCLRLCFQVFIEGPEKGKFTVQLPPIVSDAIYDKKAMAELIIVKLSHYSAPCTGGKEIILLCDRVAKDDIQVRFVQESSSQGIIWEAFGEFLANDVHKQVAISLRTPKYFDENILQPVTVHIQLRRPSDGCLSLPRSFQITPRELDPDGLVRKRHKRLKEENYDLLQEYIQLASKQSPSQQVISTSKHLLSTTVTGGITIKTEMSPGPAVGSLSSPRSYSSNAISNASSQQQQQFQYIQHSSPQHVISDASSSGMSPSCQQHQNSGQYDQNSNVLQTPYSSPYHVNHQSSPPPPPQQSSASSSIAYALAAAMVVSSSGSACGGPGAIGSPIHHQHHFHHPQQPSPNPSQGSYSSPIHSPATNTSVHPVTSNHHHHHHQQEIPNEVMERFDSLDIDSSELIPDLDFNSNTMLSLMMDTSSGLSINDSFNDITNNNTNNQQQHQEQVMINGNVVNSDQSSSESSSTTRTKLKLNLQSSNNNLTTTTTTTTSLDTPIIEMLTNSGSCLTYDNGNGNDGSTNTIAATTNHQIFPVLDLDNNNHLTHMN